MISDWKYNPEDYNADGFGLIPPGNYRVRIEKATERTSRSGKDMVELTLKVSGYDTKLWFYLVFDTENADAMKYTNQKLGSIYDSFNIPAGSLDIYDWEGKTGGAKIRQKPDQNGEMRSEIHYFLKRSKVDELPAWREGSKAPDPTEPPDDVDTFGANIDNIPF